MPKLYLSLSKLLHTYPWLPSEKFCFRGEKSSRICPFQADIYRTLNEKIWVKLSLLLSTCPDVILSKSLIQLSFWEFLSILITGRKFSDWGSNLSFQLSKLPSLCPFYHFEKALVRTRAAFEKFFGFPVIILWIWAKKTSASWSKLHSTCLWKW